MKNKDGLKGAISALIMSLPIAMVVAIIYRFPVPLVGYIHGTENIQAIPIAWVFYNLFGGFIVLLGGGAIIGTIIGSKFEDKSKKNIMIYLCSAIFALCCVAVLSVLDKIIGPW